MRFNSKANISIPFGLASYCTFHRCVWQGCLIILVIFQGKAKALLMGEWKTRKGLLYIMCEETRALKQPTWSKDVPPPSIFPLPHGTSSSRTRSAVACLCCQVLLRFSASGLLTNFLSDPRLIFVAFCGANSETRDSILLTTHQKR